jgi:hypothetical protein
MGHRRTWDRARAGQPYVVEWLEWHVECAHPGCEAHHLIAPIGSGVEDVKDAEAAMRSGKTEDGASGWVRVGGLWHCPAHALKE